MYNSTTSGGKATRTFWGPTTILIGENVGAGCVAETPVSAPKPLLSSPTLGLWEPKVTA
ncbi:MAG: hypothetical protein GXO13_03630 [Epsilonproteobacteria bacterium]|nr:hypothetical protein [Campylobacterota bacterium]